MLNIHYFMHAPFEGLAYISDWANEKGHKLSVTKFYENFTLPDIKEIAWLVIMGGPMSVNEEDIYPWLKTEKNYIKNVIDSNKVVIGVCLGAQLVADVLGAKVYKNNFKEIGWFPVHITAAAKQNYLFSQLPDELEVFHWHGETFDLPIGAIHIAENEACKNQAFLYKEKILGFQFHFEMTEKSIKEMLDGDDDVLIPEKFVQSVLEIKQKKEFIKKSNESLKKILDDLENVDK
jgi:GMP synthase-like glutamine amidotransferase